MPPRTYNVIWVLVGLLIVIALGIYIYEHVTVH